MRREVILPADEKAPLLARTVLNRIVPPPELGERHDDARLALSEVASNAVRHAALRDRDVVRMVIDADEDHVRVELEQPTPATEVRLVEPGIQGPDRIGGFGLHIVDQTADRWGYEAGPPGRVWFEFKRELCLVVTSQPHADSPTHSDQRFVVRCARASRS